ncbi:MAG TPA: tetratricopeptide repeat protein, partial [Acidobacteriota bacterium]|nr:tetratricopeptide repeat protein [Acidobacteriota bacterium]
MMHPHNLSKRLGLSCFLGLVLALNPFFICVAVAQSVQPSENLEPGKAVERELKGGEKHTYLTTLKANDYVKLVVEQKGADVVIRLIGPDGKTIQEVNSLYIKQGQKQLSSITSQPGRYVVEIESLVKTSPPGKYELKLAVAKTATESDRAELDIETLLGEVAKLTQAGKFDQALPIAEQAVAKSETAFGPDHPLVATCLNELSAIYWNKNVFEPNDERNLGLSRPSQAS